MFETRSFRCNHGNFGFNMVMIIKNRTCNLKVRVWSILAMISLMHCSSRKTLSIVLLGTSRLPIPTEVIDRLHVRNQLSLENLTLTARSRRSRPWDFGVWAALIQTTQSHLRARGTQGPSVYFIQIRRLPCARRNLGELRVSEVVNIPVALRAQDVNALHEAL